MPNWIEGTIKFRGTKAQLLYMMRNGLTSMKLQSVQHTMALLAIMNKSALKELPDSDIVIEEDEYGIYAKSEDGFVVKHLRRATITGSLECEIDEDEDEIGVKKHILLCENFRAAWDLDPKDLFDFCKEFEVDAYFHGFERGMEFEQVIEIADGEIKQVFERKYTEYAWECPFPHYGG